MSEINENLEKIYYLDKDGAKRLVDKSIETFAPIDHTHTAEEIGADSFGSADNALTLSKEYTNTKFDVLGGTVEITDGEPVKSGTVLTVNPDSTDEINLYTSEEVDAIVNNLDSSKADINHNHDDVYYTESEIDTKINETKSYADDKDATTLSSANEYTDGKIEESTEYINEQINSLGGTVEITSEEPEKSGTVLAINPNSNSEINIYTTEEVDSVVDVLSSQVAFINIEDNEDVFDNAYNVTLGIHTDGLIYIFINGQPVGNGLALSGGGAQDSGITCIIDENNTITISGDLLDGTYTLKYINNDGSTTEIGTLTIVEDNHYLITRNLTNCYSDSSHITSIQNTSFAHIEHIIVNSGYELSNVTVTMGGIDITNSVYSNGEIELANVTGDIVITAEAVSTEINGLTNQVPISLDYSTDDVFNGNGYMNNGYYSTSTGVTSKDDYVLTGLIPYTLPSTGLPSAIYIKGAELDLNDTVNRIAAFNSSKEYTILIDETQNFDIEELGTNYYKLTPKYDNTNPEISELYANMSGYNIAYISLTLTGTGEDLIVALGGHIDDTPDDDTQIEYDVTNVVTTSLDYSSDSVFNTVGYKDNAYYSSSSGINGVKEGYVLTGLIPYTIPSTGLPKTIYIKGVVIDPDDSYRRIAGFKASKEYIGMIDIWHHFTVEELGENYYKLTPKYDNTHPDMSELYANIGGLSPVYINFSLNGKGENLIITLDEPIENSESTPSYTNLADPTLATDTTLTPTSTGWMEDKRINSSGFLVTETDNDVTNFIELGDAEVVRIKNMDIYGGYGRIYMYEVGEYIYPMDCSGATSYFTELTDEYAEITVENILSYLHTNKGSSYNCTQIRFGGTLTGTKEDVIITLDEEIA